MKKKLEEKEALKTAYLQFSDLLQLLLCFLASKAWTSLFAALLPSLSAPPAPWAIAQAPK